MNDKEFKRLVRPVNELVGYARSAQSITPESDLEGWRNQLVTLAQNLANAWDDVAVRGED